MKAASDLVVELSAVFPGSRLRLDAGLITGPIRFEDQFHSVRLRSAPFLEVFLDLAAVEGFELVVQWGDRRRDHDVGDPQIDDAFFIKTNDAVLATRWFDEPVRAALATLRARLEQEDASLAASYAYDASPFQLRTPWRFELTADRLTWSRSLHVVPVEELVATLRLLCTLAGAPGRWAARVATLATLTGSRVKRTADRIALGAPAFVVEHQRMEVTVGYARRSADGGIERLSTWVTARRATAVDGAWSIVSRDVAAGPIGPVSGRKLRAPASLRRYVVRSTEGITPPYARVVGLTRGAGSLVRAVNASETEIVVWLDGVIDDAEPIALAVRLVAELASDAAGAVGPYR